VVACGVGVTRTITVLVAADLGPAVRLPEHVRVNPGARDGGPLVEEPGEVAVRVAEQLGEERLGGQSALDPLPQPADGEVLVRDFKLSPALIDTALRRQLLTRLGVIEQHADRKLGSFRRRQGCGALGAAPCRQPGPIGGT